MVKKRGVIKHLYYWQNQMKRRMIQFRRFIQATPEIMYLLRQHHCAIRRIAREEQIHITSQKLDDNLNLVQICPIFAAIQNLSGRQIAAINSILNGEVCLKEVAYHLEVSYGTLRNQLSRVYDKLDVACLEELCQYLYNNNHVRFLKDLTPQ